MCVCGSHCRLVELSEQIEVMESVLQLRGRSLDNSHTSSLNLSDHLKNQSVQLHQKLVLLSPSEAQFLLVQYVEKVISLRMTEARQRRDLEEVRLRLDKEREKFGVLEQSLKKVHLQRDIKTAKMSKVGRVARCE